jgi:hypothetical protein
VKHGTCENCVLHPVCNNTIWWPSSRGVKEDQGSTSGYEVSECKILVVRKCTMG